MDSTIAPPDVHAAKPSYANAMANKESVLELSNPSGLLARHGDMIYIKINEATYQHRVNLCQNSLIEKIMLLKGDSLWTFDALKSSL